MDPEFSNCSSSTIDSIRRAGIGRRGGVKVRGGRLPPVQIQSVLAKKKVVAPKIPQRRVKIKQEKTCDTDVFQPYSHPVGKSQELRGRGRGRGRGTKVFIQTEGTLLGDGPALRIKKEREYASYERASVPRNYKNSVSNIKIEESIIENLLESYEETEVYEDYENDLIPVKYPFAKLTIKKEIKENLESEEIKSFIKVEPGVEPPKDNKIPLEGKYFTSIKRDSLPVVKNLMADIKKTEEGKSIMMLLQFPSCLPYEILPDTEHLKDKKKAPNYNADNKKEQTDNNTKASLSGIPEGHLGKLQVLMSGKMRLVIGSIHISFEEGIALEHLCEVVSMPVEKNEGDAIVLGRIERKMILKPHFTDVTKN